MKRSTWADIASLPILVALTFALYWPALKVFFSLDDLQFLLQAAGYEQWPDGIARILSTRLYFSAAWKLFGDNPMPYHVVVLLLHAANSWLVHSVARRLGLEKWASYAASVLFLIAPVAFLPLHWISGIQEVSMTFFALIAAFFFLGRSRAAAAISFIAAILALLCKGTSTLLLPALALFLPASRTKKLILGVGGLFVGVAVFAAAGRFTPRPPGDPYESALGLNIVRNFFTYTAWLVRIWDYFPSRNPHAYEGISGWGLVLPAFAALIAWRFRKTRRHLAFASCTFLMLLAPVLPLVRHSYFYYLYLPLVPFWMLGGAALRRIRPRPIAIAVIVLCAAVSITNEARHRRAELHTGLPLDPILRYAASAEYFAESLRATGAIEEGQYLFILPPGTKSYDIASDANRLKGSERYSFVPGDQALLGGRALRLLFPAVRSASFEYFEEAPEDGWESKHIYLMSGLGELRVMGYGEEGRRTLALFARQSDQYAMAEKQMRALVRLRPDNATYWYLLGEMAAKQDKLRDAQAVLDRLEEMALENMPPGEARTAADLLKKAIMAQTGPLRSE